MKKYIALMKLTHKGTSEIHSIPQRLADAAIRLESMGGRMTDFYATSGAYDYVGITRVPNERVAKDFIASLNSDGYLRTTTLRGKR